MKQVLIMTVFGLFALIVTAQSDSTRKSPTLLLEQKINGTRLELKQSFLSEDPAGVGLWLDSLQRLEDDSYIAMNWDERWLLYYWMENYGALFDEASQFGASERLAQSWKVPPPNDSLFELIDAGLLERQYDIFQSIRHGFLSSEEKIFATLLLEYLLRLNADEDEWAERLESFEAQFPASRFNYFLSSVKPPLLRPANKAFGLSAAFLSGTWTNQLSRSLRPLYGFRMDAYYWIDRWNLGLNMLLGGPKLARDVTDGLEIWPKDDPTNFISVGLDLGYDIINNAHVRLTPAIGGSVAALSPPSVDEDSGEEAPEYYDNFNFLEANLNVSLTADAKLFKKDYRRMSVPKGSYHGVRLQVGYNWLNLKGQNTMLGGHLFYLAVGYNLFAYREAKNKKK